MVGSLLRRRRITAERLLIIFLLAILTTILSLGKNASSELFSDLAPRLWLKNSVSLPRGSGTKFSITSMITDETSYDYPAFSTKTRYAQKHNYDIFWDFEPSPYPKVWSKLSLIRDQVERVFNGEKAYEWIMMVDYDVLITNSSIKLEDIVERSLVFAENSGKRRQDIDLILAKDCQPINAGVMFFRASVYVLDFIKEWRKGRHIEGEGGQGKYDEQEVLWLMLGNNTMGMVDHSVIVPQTWFDAYPEELNMCRDERDPADWDPSMFLVHLAGASWHLRDEMAHPVQRLMWKYFRRILDGKVAAVPSEVMATVQEIEVVN